MPELATMGTNSLHTGKSVLFRRGTVVERLFFLLICILTAIPALKPEYFPSLDGPAHLYNARIIADLIHEPNGFFSQYVEFNPIPVPNSAGHYFIYLLNYIFSPEISSRILIATYLIGLPYAFRFCVRRFSPSATISTYLAFPFTYAMTFTMGFYNYHLGLVVLLFAAGILVNYFSDKNSWRKIVLLLFLITLSYFCHLVVFAALGFIVILLAVFSFFKRTKADRYFKKLLVLFTVSVPALVMSAIYFTALPKGGENTFLPTFKLIEHFTGFRSLICYRQEEELIFSSGIFIVLAVLAGAGISLMFKLKKDHEAPSEKQRLPLNLVFLCCSLIFLVLYFRLPDFTPNGGLLSTRLNFLVMIFLALWIATLELPRKLLLSGVTLVIICHFGLVSDHNKAFRDISAQQWQFNKMEKHLRPGTSLAGVNIGSWLDGHNSNYLGLKKKVLILDNYELSNSYFPLRWKKSPQLNRLLDERNQPYYFDSVKGPDYILLGDKEESKEFAVSISGNYKMITRTPLLMLYGKK